MGNVNEYLRCVVIRWGYHRQYHPCLSKHGWFKPPTYGDLMQFWWGKCQKIRYSVTPSHKAYGDVLCDSSAFRLLRLATSNPRRAQSQGSQPSPSAANFAMAIWHQTNRPRTSLPTKATPDSLATQLKMFGRLDWGFPSHWSHWCPMIQWDSMGVALDFIHFHAIFQYGPSILGPIYGPTPFGQPQPQLPPRTWVKDSDLDQRSPRCFVHRWCGALVVFFGQQCCTNLKEKTGVVCSNIFYRFL